MSALPLKAGIAAREDDVRYVPKADIKHSRAAGPGEETDDSALSPPSPASLWNELLARLRPAVCRGTPIHHQNCGLALSAAITFFDAGRAATSNNQKQRRQEM
jgi:hypothetical protein